MVRKLIVYFWLTGFVSSYAQTNKWSVPISIENYGQLNMSSTNLKAGIKFQRMELTGYVGTNAQLWAWGAHFKYFLPRINSRWNPYCGLRAGEGIRLGSDPVRQNILSVTMGCQAQIIPRACLFAEFGVGKLYVHNLDRSPLPGGSFYSKPFHGCAAAGIQYYIGRFPEQFRSDAPLHHSNRGVVMGTSFIHNWTSFFSNEPFAYAYSEFPLSVRFRAEAGINLMMNPYREWVHGFGVDPRWAGLRLGGHYMPLTSNRIESHLITRMNWIHYTSDYSPAGDHLGFDISHKLRFHMKGNFSVDLGTGYGLRWQVLPNAPGPANLYYQTWLETGLSYNLQRKQE